MSDNLPNERILNVATEIGKAFRSVVDKDETRRDARDTLQDASNEASNEREKFLVTLAEAANKDHWSQFEIDNGADKALAQRNTTDKDNSVKTFAAEIKRACHPNARKHVRKLSELANDVWDREIAQDKKLPRPCREAFARKYHLLQRLIGEAIEKHVIESAPDVISFAVSNDPRRNPERMFKKFKLLRDQLRELADDYPLDEIVTAVEGLHDLALADFKTADRSALKPTPEVSPEPEKAPEDVSEGEDSAPEDHEAVEPAQGVSDLLDEALKDISGIAA